MPSKCFAVASYGYLGNLHNTILDLKATDTKRNFFNKPENMIQYPKVILYCRQTQLNTPPLRYRHKKKLLKPENMRSISRSHFILPKKAIKYICKVWVPMFSFSQLKFGKEKLKENVKGTKLFSHGNNASGDLSYPKTNLFHYLVRVDLWWMMLVTV